MLYRAHIEIEFTVDEDDDEAMKQAEEYAEAITDLPGVIDAWVANLEDDPEGN